ncbi:hypothetical protein [Pelomicrobium sp. G1]|uniref:hypothetical protein n=1 Tax=unclassified Pelomicrobium TaxID=2815318 RepID=UPI003F75CE3A
MEKEKLPKRGPLYWSRQYFAVGDKVTVRPLMSPDLSWVGTVEKVTRNKYKRVSYVVNGKPVLLEELLKNRNRVQREPGV